MFKAIKSLFRARAHEAAHAALDQHAIAILRQQIRDCAEAIGGARKAVALAIAQNEQETHRHTRILFRIADLETRALAALEQGKEILAHETAEVIASLESERDISEQAQETFGAEIMRLKKMIRVSEGRLRELQRGERLAAANEKAQRLRQIAPGIGQTTLREAEETLANLRDRQRETETAAAALDQLEQVEDPDALTRKLAAAGCGPALRTSADDVLTRLKARRPTDDNLPA